MTIKPNSIQTTVNKERRMRVTNNDLYHDIFASFLGAALVVYVFIREISLWLDINHIMLLLGIFMPVKPTNSVLYEMNMLLQ